MTSIKEKLQSSQGSANNIPKLDILHRITLKENNGEVYFAVWDKAEKVNVQFPVPIEGILIGQAMEAISYSDNLGSKGGNYTSSHYFTNNDAVALFAPSAKGYDVVHKGNMASIEAFVKENSTGNLKKKQVLFVLTQEGLLAISTNLTIAIDQIKTNKEALSERYVILHPQLYNATDKTISARAKGFLGKLVKTNPPKFATISVGELISEEDFTDWKAEEMIANYSKWKEFKIKGGVEKENNEEYTEPSTIQNVHEEIGRPLHDEFNEPPFDKDMTY